MTRQLLVQLVIECAIVGWAFVRHRSRGRDRTRLLVALGVAGWTAALTLTLFLVQARPPWDGGVDAAVWWLRAGPLTLRITVLAFAGVIGAPGGSLQLRPTPRTVVAGVAAGAGATVAVWLLAAAELRMGVLDAPLWQVASGGSPLAALLAGLRNLGGEEAAFRLGVQAPIAAALGSTRAARLWAVVFAALAFEVWHFGGDGLLGLNATAAIVFGVTFARWGYASAAVAHATADVMVLGLLPMLKL